jgi:hypothetical protein
MNTKLIAKTGIVFLLGGLMSISLFSCRKEGDTIARIQVVDTSGAPFPGAMVRLYPTPTIIQHGAIIIDDTLFTDLDGYAIFDYTDMYNLGQAGFAVLDIEVKSGDTLYGEGIIKIEDEVTTEEKVIIQP